MGPAPKSFGLGDRLRGLQGLLPAVALLAVLAPAGGPGPLPAAAAENPEPALARPQWAGRTLTAALKELRVRGLRIVFSTNVVRPDMRVETEPAAGEPREILDEILAPHGLLARQDASGVLVVVRGPHATAADGGAIRGRVYSRRSAEPLAGAMVRLLGRGVEVTTGDGGEFVVPDPGLGTYTLEVRLKGYVVERLDGVAVVAGRPAEVTVLLAPAPLLEEELIVTTSRVSLLRQEPAAPLALSRDEILSLPHLGDDFFRTLSLLPGVAANDVTAQFHVRGGRRDETQILLDGQELYEAFHLKDFDSALSFVAPSTLGSADLTTGGFAAAYGDRMSGVLEMTTIRPTGAATGRVGVSFLNAHAGGAGTFRDERGAWLAEVRRGSADLVGRLLGDEDPRYWDLAGKLDYRLGDRHSLRGNALHSGDELDFREVVGEESKRFETEYDSSYLWLTHQAVLGRSALVESAASMTLIDRDRRGVELEDDARFAILDRRDSDVAGLRQSWSHQLTPRHTLDWGWQRRRFETDYDYTGTRDFDNPLARIRHDFGQQATDFQGGFRDDHDSAHLSGRLRLLEPLTLELGARWDRHSQTRESHLSPRLNLAWAVGRSGVVRAAWGRFNQSQRPYELQVEDGERRLAPVERAEHRVLGFERLFRTGSGEPGVALRVELYRREVGNPRARYENLYEPLNVFPEVEPDRVRITPRRSRAEGVEVFVRGRLGTRARWWVNYAWASTEDLVDGPSGRTSVPRLFDQTHTLNLDLDYRLGEHWRVNLAWRYHTGWPTTALSLAPEADDEGGVVFVPVLGPLNAQRLPDYHRLDVRASRRWQLRSVALDLYVDVQNAYNRKNVAGFDFEIDEEAGTLEASAEAWAGLLPSAGISVEF